MSTVREQASARVQAVDAAFDDAIGKWTGASVSLGAIFGITPQDQVLGALRQMKTLGRDPWAARRDKLAENDAAGWARWVQDGNDLLKNLADTAQDAQAASLTGIVVNTVVASASDVKQAAQSVWSAKWLIVTGIVAIAVIVWKVKSS